MSRPTRRTGVRPSLLAVAAGLTAAALLSGCGVSDGELRPGVAVSADGTDVSLTDVDDATEAVCSYLGSGEVQQFTPFPRVIQRQTTATVLLQEVALRALMGEQDLALPDDYGRTISDLEAQFADLDDDVRDEVVDYATTNTYVGAAASAVGFAEFEAEDSAPGSADIAQQRGLAAAATWLEEHDAVVNPVLGLDLTEAGPVPADDDVSVAASDRAVAGVLDLEDPTVTDKIAGLVATLPAEQVCGA
ncbi:hypothetical protein FE634_05690 [Nocardioides dongxiaopingii]|uniref:hypothetical protein n=1 Tax=Nocardioides TaxID=1839 RepID=UPI0010C76824|nr:MULTISPECIES: hypothetical protein [Nocardioides]QCW50023.1 hypothetical protein FE634_05690 [Nocardioides sp. S-1144]